MEHTHIQRYFYSALIVGILVVAFAAWRYVNFYGASIEPSSFRSFSVTGEGKTVAIPNVATFTFTVLTQGGTDLSALQKENVKKMNAAIDFIKSENVDAKDITTQAYAVEPRYEYANCRPEKQTCPPPFIAGYTITQTAKVKVRDFSKTGTLLKGVVERGANSVSSLSFSIDDTTVAENIARKEAIQKAKNKARAIADAGGFTLGRLLGIQENNKGYPQLMYEIDTYAKSDASAPPTIEPGSQDVTVFVTLQYEIR